MMSEPLAKQMFMPVNAKSNAKLQADKEKSKGSTQNVQGTRKMKWLSRAIDLIDVSYQMLSDYTGLCISCL